MSKYFENLWCFTKFSFHHKWNEAWLLVINWYVWVSSWVAKRLNENYLSSPAFHPRKRSKHSGTPRQPLSNQLIKNHCRITTKHRPHRTQGKETHTRYTEIPPHHPAHTYTPHTKHTNTKRTAGCALAGGSRIITT